MPTLAEDGAGPSRPVRRPAWGRFQDDVRASPFRRSVVLDMVDLVKYLSSLREAPPDTVAAWLKAFTKTNTPRSFNHLEINCVDVDWACQGFLADLFNLIACVRYLARDDSTSRRKKVHQAEIQGWNWDEEGPRRWPEECQFPGSSSLMLRNPYVTPNLHDNWH